MLAILPIRSGSQRVKHKNITLINGKPLYIYIVETLKKVKQIDKIIINTDYKIIHNAFADDEHVEVMNRDKDLRGNCNINLVIDQVLKLYDCKYILQTHATNPFIRSNTLDDAIENFFKYNKNYDSLFSVTKVQKRFWSSDSKPVNHIFHSEPTTQSLDPFYEENSCIYIFSKESFQKIKNRIGTKPMMYEIPKNEAWDIDDKEDMKIVKKLMSQSGL